MLFDLDGVLVDSTPCVTRVCATWTRDDSVNGAALQSKPQQGDGDSAKRQKSSHHRELDVPATPRPGGGEKQPQQPNMLGQRNSEGVGNLVSADKTVLDSPERGATGSGKGNNKNRKKR